MEQEHYSRIAAAYRELAEVFDELAEADEEEEEQEEEKPRTRTRSNGNGKANGKSNGKATTTRTRSRTKRDEDEDPDENEEGEDEEDEITLETLQDLGDKLIKAKRKSALLTILKSFKAANISGIKKRDYTEAHAAMQDILEG